jgi:hypothetical protein
MTNSPTSKHYFAKSIPKEHNQYTKIKRLLADIYCLRELQRASLGETGGMLKTSKRQL